MHALLLVSSFMLVVLSGCVALAVLRRSEDWPHRRQVQLAVLAAPIMVLGVGLGGLHHFPGSTCFLRTPSWDYVAGLALPVGMAAVALAGLGLGFVRIAVTHLTANYRGRHAQPDVQWIAESLSRIFGTPTPRVLIVATRRPLALTVGVRQPAVLLSDWMLTHLDPRELESVLAHELGHVARRDVLVTWLATVLRDAFFYLPTSRAAFHRFRFEREVACDGLAAKATGRPLALASALAKVWHQDLRGPAVGSAEALAASDDMIEQRIHRLMAGSAPQMSAGRRRVSVLGPGLQSLLGVGTLLAANAVVMLTPMGCGPASAMWKL